MTDRLSHNPFAALRGLRDAMGPAEEPGDAPTAGPEQPSIPADVRIARAVVRLERSGRGGKEVTRIDHLGLDSDVLERWLKELKGALGCGGTIEGTSIVLQGDQRQRLPALLTARGVRRVVG